MQKFLAGFAAVAATFVAQAATYDVEAGNVDRVIELAATAPDNSIINLAAGVYDFSRSTTNNPSYGAILVTPSGRTLHFRGAGTKHWSEKTRAEETVLIGHGKYALFYGVNGSSRCSKFYNLTFECCTNTASVAAAGAIAMTANECYASTPPGFATNCVFRNCYSSKSSGGATSYLSAYDCLYTNCVSTSGGGGAYGGDKTISGGASHSTNCFVKCTFVDCQASSGGGLYCDADNCVRDCTFIGCRATGTGCHGGGLYISKAMCELVGCTFVSNSSAKANGGGLMLASNLHRLADCTFVGNTAYGDGGGLRSAGSGFDNVENCAFTNNTSTGGMGGAISCKVLGAVSNCVFRGGRAKTAAGVGIESTCGDFVGCTFDDNRNNTLENLGSHLNNGLSATDCRFTGFGDLWCRTIDRCVFDGCEYYPNNGSYYDGLVRFGMQITTPENIGTIRNCLFRNCFAPVLIDNETYYDARIENCTFVDNTLTNAFHHDGYTFYCMRGTHPDDGKTHPGTNRISNCIFWNNWVANGTDGTKKRNDVNFFRTTNLDVGNGAANIVKNCIYGVKSGEEPQGSVNFKVGDPRFVAGDSRFPDAPYYMPKRTSDARKAGLWFDWMAGAKDLVGADMPSAAPVDLGCYQCTLPSLGLLLLLR